MNFLEFFFVGQNQIERSARFTAELPYIWSKICERNMQILRAVLETILDGGKPPELVHGGSVRLQNG